MAELNFQQITDKLNAEFTGEIRRLIFWYDVNGDFKDDVDGLALENAKVWHLEPDNQFYTKYYLECVDTTTNYLVYAPFAKPNIRDNHLSDTIRYSKEFFADRASLLALDLGIDERFKPVIQHYIKFFGEKKRTQAFYALEIENFNRSTIEVALMSVLCKCKTPSFEEVLRCVLTDGEFENNRYLAEFSKFDLLNSFWKHCEAAFGYSDTDPQLEKLVMTLFVTYFAKELDSEIPQAWKPYVSFKAGNVATFLDNLMNSVLYGERFDEISSEVFAFLHGAKQLTKLPVEALVNTCIFSHVDTIILNWMIERLENEDADAKLDGKSIPELCAYRRKLHFGKAYRNQYFVVENAYHIIKRTRYIPTSNFSDLLRRYLEQDYQLDRRYRYFYLFFDQLEDSTRFERVRELVENIYSNDYLSRLLPNWCDTFVSCNGKYSIQPLHSFYEKHVRPMRERVVVIVSDAMRYEVGRSLLEKLQSDEKCHAELTVMQSTLPSITRLGMAALLPHRELAYLDDGTVLVDSMPSTDIKQREAILQKYEPASCCVQYDDLKGMKIAELRDVFTGKNVVYVYHNQIDARGDRANTENEVFAACEEAIDEIFALIKRLSTSANTLHFIVTADHGFIYKRDKLLEADKISGFYGAGKRYLVTSNTLDADGVDSLPLAINPDGEDTRKVYFPTGSDLFKTAGSGLNFVHGGCSPQEMLVPVIRVKVEKGYREVTSAQISLVSLTTKITNLITTLDFLQTEPVSDVIKETSYRIYFISEDGEKISSENLVTADRKDVEAQKRMFRLRFSFKNQKYDRFKKYYLVAHDEKNDLEVLRREIIMDIAFADDFGFGF